MAKEKIITYDNLAVFKREYDKLLRELVVPLTEEEFEELEIKNPNSLYLVLDEDYNDSN